ncbi:MAG TPA: hypothetical protein VMY18_00275 [Acidobacteriota bacterium]|nr:hypothetical protein [Acidobacteriota bacterium]
MVQQSHRNTGRRGKMTLLNEPLWVKIFTSAVIVAWVLAFVNLVEHWRDDRRTKVNIGERVWLSSFGRVEHWEKCPDCFGTKKIHVTLANGEEFDIPCQGCAPGYDPPRGEVQRWTYEAQAEEYTVTGISVSQFKETEYELSGGRIGYESNVFSTKEAALKHSEGLRAEREAEENKRLSYKEKDHRSWAWHVHHYRSELKRAERNAEHYRERLGIAKEKVNDSL